MSSTDLPTALTRILVDKGLSDLLLRGELDELARQLSYAPEALRGLRAINVTGLRRFREILQAKHLRHALTALPSCVGYLVAARGDATVREELWTEAPLPASAAVDLGRRYLDLTASYLERQDIPGAEWLPDTARYERMLTELRSASAPPPAGPPETVRLAPGVGLGSYGWDVTVILPILPDAPAAPAPAAVHVVARLVGQRVEVRKVGRQPFAMLADCRTSQPRAEVLRRAVSRTDQTSLKAVTRFLDEAVVAGLIIEDGVNR